MNKTEVTKAIKEDYEKQRDKTLKATLTPLEIWVNGDMAYVHYSFTKITEVTGKLKIRLEGGQIY